MSAKLIYIYGPQGSGKNALATTIARGLIENEGVEVALYNDFAPTCAGVRGLKKLPPRFDYAILTFNDPGALHILPPPHQTIHVEKGGQK